MILSNEEKRIVCSVIILTYKQLKHLPNTIKSIVGQTYPCIEIVISDDGTPGFDVNSIRAVCDKYCGPKNIKYVICHAEKNQGTVKNFNQGIAASTGALIIPMAGDNQFYSKDAIHKIVVSYEKKQWLIATGKQVLCEENQKLEIRPYKNEIALLKKANERYLALRLAMFPCFIGGAVTTYSRDVFQKHGMFDEDYMLLEDCPYYVKILMKGEKIEFINEILVNHSVNRKSKRSNLLIEDDIHVIDQIINSVEKLKKWQRNMLLFRKKRLMMESGKNMKYQIEEIPYLIVYILYKIYTKMFRVYSKIETISLD